MREPERTETNQKGHDTYVQGIVAKLDRRFPLIRLEDGRLLRCEYAVSLTKGQRQNPVIGDKVLVDIPQGHDKGIILETLPRTTQFVRKDPTERAQSQVLAANFDVVLVAQPIEDVQYRRLERELVLAHETGASVVVVLTKADLVQDKAKQTRIEADLARFIGADRLMVVSQENPSSVDELARYLAEDNKMAILIGRSGVGKSSLINLIVGRQVQETAPIRARDGKGRHTTVTREIIPLPKGGFLVDMPGVRGLGLWDVKEGLGAAFSDVEQLAQNCKFKDCTHTSEPGCAVKEALQNGSLSSSRLDSYRRLKEESAQISKRREEANRIKTRRGHPRRRG